MRFSRRQFLKTTAAQAGVLLGGAACAAGTAGAGRISGRPPRDVVVVGAGVFGLWTAWWLRRLGASVTVVDLYGPGNSRATSGDETRGVRTSYGDRELWIRWANEAIARWRAWDDEWSERLGTRLFFPTGDLILRPEWDPWLTDTRAQWERLRVPYEVLSLDEVAYRYPQISLDNGMAVAVLERNAGVVRARGGCHAVAAVLRQKRVQFLTGRARLGERAGGRLHDVALEPEGRLAGQAFVFACGPWLAKVLPEVMGNRMRTPLGHVFYFGTPAGDARWVYPNMPSWNVPGVTGWPALPPDYRGFRVRTGGRPPGDPDESVRWLPPDAVARGQDFLCTWFPGIAHGPLLETRACHYELTVNRNFVVDRHPELDNVWIAGGGNAEGYKFGPVIGEYVARRVLGLDTDPALVEEFRIPTDTFEPSSSGWRGDDGLDAAP